MARSSISAPTRTVYLLLANDPFRARLRLVELVGALVAGRPTETAGLERWPSPDLGAPLGLTRLDARDTTPDAILMSGRSQGLFDAVDERRVILVEHAEELKDHAFVSEFPDGAALVLVSSQRVASRSRAPRKKTTTVAPADLPGAVVAAGGTVETVARLDYADAPRWIVARASLRGVTLAPDAIGELAAAAGADAERIEQELAKLAAFAAGRRVEADDVRTLVAGAIEADVFKLTEAVVKREVRTAIRLLDRLLEDGQAPQQILALLVWQFRILLFASAMKGREDAERMAKAIRASSPASLYRWQAQARRVDRKTVTRAYEALYATDLAIKQGRVPHEQEGLVLTLCVLDLCGTANADPRELVVGEPPRR